MKSSILILFMTLLATEQSFARGSKKKDVVDYQRMTGGVEKCDPEAPEGDHVLGATGEKSVDYLIDIHDFKIVPPKCEGNQVDVLTVQFPQEDSKGLEKVDSQLKDFLNNKIKDVPKCISTSFFEDLAKFSRSVRKSKWDCSVSEIFELFSSISAHRAQWSKQAAKLNKIIKVETQLGRLTDPNSKAEIFIKPDGELIISYKNSFIGKGANKEAYSRIGISSKEGKLDKVKELVALTPLDATSNNEINKELKTYDKIRAYKSKLPPGHKLEGLAEADLIELADNKRALIQRRFDTDLKKSGLLSDPIKGPAVLKKVATGLHHLHNMGLVQGDLKEDNVLVNNDGSDVAISDFGLTYDPRNNIEPRTTASHEAPEMVRQRLVNSDNVELVQKRDIFGFGIIALHSVPGYENASLYTTCGHLFTGYGNWGSYGDCVKQKAGPFHQQIVQLADRACAGKPRSYCKEAIIADCLNPDPLQRPNADTLAARMDGLVN